MSTHNICFCGEIRKVLCEYPSYLELCVCLLMLRDDCPNIYDINDTADDVKT